MVSPMKAGETIDPLEGVLFTNPNAMQARLDRCRKLAMARARRSAPSFNGTVAGDRREIDTRKQQRMLRNRESAALSRKRKTDRIVELKNQVESLKGENRRIRRQIMDSSGSTRREEVLSPPFYPPVMAPSTAADTRPGGTLATSNVIPASSFHMHDVDGRTIVGVPASLLQKQQHQQHQRQKDACTSTSPPIVVAPDSTAARTQFGSISPDCEKQLTTNNCGDFSLPTLIYQSGTDQATMESSAEWTSGSGCETEAPTDTDVQQCSFLSDHDMVVETSHTNDEMKYDSPRSDFDVKPSVSDNATSSTASLRAHNDEALDHLVTELMAEEMPGAPTVKGEEDGERPSPDVKSHDLLLFLEGLDVVRSPDAHGGRNATRSS